MGRTSNAPVQKSTFLRDRQHGVVALGPPMAKIGLGGRVARGGVLLLVGPPRGASATEIASGNQHAQRGRGLALFIVPVTGQVGCMAPVLSIPAVVAEPDGGVGFLDSQISQRCFWSTGAAGILASAGRWPLSRLSPGRLLAPPVHDGGAPGADLLARRRTRWYSSRCVDGARQGWL
jgi:hypothetical protein